MSLFLSLLFYYYYYYGVFILPFTSFRPCLCQNHNHNHNLICILPLPTRLLPYHPFPFFPLNRMIPIHVPPWWWGEGSIFLFLLFFTLTWYLLPAPLSTYLSLPFCRVGPGWRGIRRVWSAIYYYIYGDPVFYWRSCIHTTFIYLCPPPSVFCLRSLIPI